MKEDERPKCPRKLSGRSPTECFVYAKIGAFGMWRNRRRFTGIGARTRSAGGSNGPTERTATTSTLPRTRWSSRKWLNGHTAFVEMMVWLHPSQLKTSSSQYTLTLKQ